MTEAGEFAEIYSLEVVEMPTNQDMIRDDKHDEVYRTDREKYDAIILQIIGVQQAQTTGLSRHDIDRKIRRIGRASQKAKNKTQQF